MKFERGDWCEKSVEGEGVVVDAASYFGISSKSALDQCQEG